MKQILYFIHLFLTGAFFYVNFGRTGSNNPKASLQASLSHLPELAQKMAKVILEEYPSLSEDFAQVCTLSAMIAPKEEKNSSYREAELVYRLASLQASALPEYHTSYYRETALMNPKALFGVAAKHDNLAFGKFGVSLVKSEVLKAEGSGLNWNVQLQTPSGTLDQEFATASSYAPKAGADAILVLYNGHIIGLVISGHIMFFETAEERWLASLEGERTRERQRILRQLDEIAKLPEPFQKRIKNVYKTGDRLRDDSSRDYELDVCRMAAITIKSLQQKQQAKDWPQLSVDAQLEKIYEFTSRVDCPIWTSDMVRHLVTGYLNDPKSVLKMHDAYVHGVEIDPFTPTKELLD